MNSELSFLLLLAIIIFVSKIAGHLSRRFLNQPVVFGEILAGLLLGPSLCNIFGWPIFIGSAETLQDLVHVVAFIGVLLLMFVAGLETDLAQMRKVGAVAMWTAILGVVLPLGLGTAVGRLFGLTYTEAVFIGAVLTATSVSITAQTLMELGQLASKEGVTILAAAVIDDILGIIVLSIVVAFSAVGAVSNGHVSLPVNLATWSANVLHMPGAAIPLQIVFVLILMLVFFATAVFIGARGFRYFLRCADSLHASHALPAVALVLVFLFAVGAEFIGQVAAITGAYIVGVFLARTPQAKPLERAIHPFTYALFVPVFFMNIGLSVNAREMLHGNIMLMVAIVLVAVLTKVIGCGIGARMTGFTGKESLRVGIGMISRGEVGLIVAQVGLTNHVIRQPEYAALVIMVLATTVVTPVLLRFTFPRAPEQDADAYETVAALETSLNEEA